MDLNYAAAAPEIFLGLAICVVLLVDVFLRDDQSETTYVLAMLALIGSYSGSSVWASRSSLRASSNRPSGTSALVAYH